MSGDDLMPYGRLRSVMTPLDMAWAVLKADPRMQAFEASGYHPETGEYRPDIRNLGTVDPAALAMGYRQIFGSEYGNAPQEMLSRLMSDCSRRPAGLRPRLISSCRMRS